MFYAIDRWYNAHTPFENVFGECEILNKPADYKKIKKNDIVLFGGGEDISTSLYNQIPSKYTQFPKPTARDVKEVLAFERCVEVEACVLGICRGAQLACALSGGELIQHVNNHHGNHQMLVHETGQILTVSSVHHQMMYPWDTQYVLIASAYPSLSSVYVGDSGKLIDEWTTDRAHKQTGDLIEPEVVYFPQTKALAIQYHPEFMSLDEPAVKYAQQLAQKVFQNG